MSHSEQAKNRLLQTTIHSNIAKCHDISLAQLRSAMKFRSKYRSMQRNIVVMQTIGLPKYRRNIAPNESSLIFVEYSRNSSLLLHNTVGSYFNPFEPQQHYTNSPYWPPYITNWENLFKHQDNSCLVVICQILMTCRCYNTLMQRGEI